MFFSQQKSMEKAKKRKSSKPSDRLRKTTITYDKSYKVYMETRKKFAEAIENVLVKLKGARFY